MLVNYYYVCIRKLWKNLKARELEIYLRKKTRTKRVFLTV